MLADDSSGVKDADENGGMFHKAVKSKSLSKRTDDDFVAYDERISNSNVESLLELKLVSRLVECDINRAETFICAYE